MKKNLNNPSQTLQYAGAVPGLPFVSDINQSSDKRDVSKKNEFNRESYKKNKQYGNLLVTAIVDCSLDWKKALFGDIPLCYHCMTRSI